MDIYIKGVCVSVIVLFIFLGVVHAENGIQNTRNANAQEPQHPECNGQLVSSYTADSVTLDLTTITIYNGTKQLCIYFEPPAHSRNKTCVSKDSENTTITGLQSGTLYTFSIFAVIANRQSLDGCRNITQTTRPKDPKCSGGLVSSFSAHNITLDLTKVVIGDKTQQLCIHYGLPSSSKNALCVSKNSQRITIPRLESGTRYSFSIYATITNQNDRIESLDGCQNINLFTYPLLDCSSVDIRNTVININGDTQKPMTTFHVTVRSSSNISEEIFQSKPSGAYYLGHFLEQGQNYTISVRGELGGLLTPNACIRNISIGPPKPTCNETLFYEAFASVVHVHTAACHANGSESFNIGLVGYYYQGLLPNTTLTFNNLPPGETLWVSVIAVGKSGMKSIPNRVRIFTKPKDPSCSKAKYQSTNNSITIHGDSISAAGANSYKVWELKNPSVTSYITQNQDATFYNLTAGTSTEFVVQSISLFGEFSIGRCIISTASRPNNPDCRLIKISRIGTHDFTLDLTAMKTVDAMSYLVEYTTNDTERNVTFTSDSLIQQLSRLTPGLMHTVTIYSIGSRYLLSLQGCTKTSYTKPEDPSCSKVKYQSTNNSITILGNSISAEGANSYKVWELKNSNVSSTITHNQDATFYNLTAGTCTEVFVQSISRHGESSIGRCIISAATRPNNPDCTLANIVRIGTHDFTLDLTAMKTVDAESYLVEYTTNDTERNVTFTSDSLIQQLARLTPGSLHTATIYSIGTRSLLSLQGCTKTSYTRPTIPADNVRVFSDTSFITMEWPHSYGNVENYTVKKICSCETSLCKPCSPSVAIFKTTDSKNSVNITHLNPGTCCNVSIYAVSGNLYSDPLQMTLKSFETELITPDHSSANPTTTIVIGILSTMLAVTIGILVWMVYQQRRRKNAEYQRQQSNIDCSTTDTGNRQQLQPDGVTEFPLSEYVEIHATSHGHAYEKVNASNEACYEDIHIYIQA